MVVMNTFLWGRLNWLFSFMLERVFGKIDNFQIAILNLMVEFHMISQGRFELESFTAVWASKKSYDLDYTCVQNLWFHEIYQYVIWLKIINMVVMNPFFCKDGSFGCFLSWTVLETAFSIINNFQITILNFMIEIHMISQRRYELESFAAVWASKRSDDLDITCI